MGRISSARDSDAARVSDLDAAMPVVRRESAPPTAARAPAAAVRAPARNS